MLLPGTQMHIVTFIFVCLESVILLYFVLYKMSRPDDHSTYLSIILIGLLLTYNITGGLLPDPSLPGSKFFQEVIAYGTGFITPCFFPYYVFKLFEFKKMKFHVKRGVFFFLFLPYVLFVLLYMISGRLSLAKDVLALPVLYALWVIYSLVVSMRERYSANDEFKSNKEANLLLLGIIPWIGLPIVAYFDLSQVTAACITNGGFLLFLSLQVSRHIRELRMEHDRLEKTEKQLIHWNTHLQEEVNKRTRELERVIEQRTNTFVNLAHETKTPLTLIQNYIEDYINKNGTSEELSIVQSSLFKLSGEIINLFDIERYNKGIKMYNHNQLCNFSRITNEQLLLFKKFAFKKKIRINAEVQPNIFTKADPVAITRLVNNLIENAIKFSLTNGHIYTQLKSTGGKILFLVRDNGFGIPENLKERVFEPYFQISHHKNVNHGMGLGLPLVKKIIRDLQGTIEIECNSVNKCGTEIKVLLKECCPSLAEETSLEEPKQTYLSEPELFNGEKKPFNAELPTILLVEDNVAMAGFLEKKLMEFYNVASSSNGNEALQIIKNISPLPDLIISDVVMDKLDGLHLAKIIRYDLSLSHIPIIFISAKSNRKDMLEGLRAGAVDFIQKPFLIEELYRKVQAILRIASMQNSHVCRDSIWEPGYKSAYSVEKEISLDKCDAYHLSRREKDIVKLISRGIRYKEIGETLFISVRTVTTHAHNIFEKVGVKNKIELLNKLQ